MVHLRLNTREANPNEHVNFITALPMRSASDSEDARQYLRALAAQVKPVMKRHGFQVNSLEEYEFNKVFSGRNWNAGGLRALRRLLHTQVRLSSCNAGETVELVLRGPGGQFLPTSWLINTFCHEARA
jgi:DNA-dependent metalloprotease WSS1